jgi:recombination protein RecA
MEMCIKMPRKEKEVKDPMLAVIANLEKSIGYKGETLIFKVGDRTTEKREVISFGHEEIDDASGIGGIQRGKVVEIFGLESSGKSYLTLKLIASAQKQGLTCFLADIEQSFDESWAKKQGVDVDELYLMNAAVSAEVALDVVDGACKCGKFGLVVLDSTAALIPQKEMEASVGKDDYALLARCMSKGVKKITSSCKIGNSACVFINQVRTTMPKNGRGGEMVTPGGKSLDFYSHQRISVFPGGMIKALNESGETEAIGKKSYVTFAKNKLGNPYKKCQIEIIFDEVAMNPIVKMVTLAKAYKIFSIKLKEYYISKEFIEGAKVRHNTLANSFGELAHWVLSNGYLEDVLWALKDFVEEEENEEKLKLVDKVVYDLIEVNENDEFVHKDLWISPLGDYSNPTDPDVAKGQEEVDEPVITEEASEILETLVKDGELDILEKELDSE